MWIKLLTKRLIRPKLQLLKRFGKDNRMSMTNGHIASFAKSVVENIHIPGYQMTSPRLQQLTDYRRLAAVTFFNDAQDAIRLEGFRVTYRVKDQLLKELLRIEHGIS